MIDGKSYPYSPSPAGANNERALLNDAMATVANATLPKIWKPGDLEVVTERATNNMKSEGWLVEEPISTKGRFRRGRGLRVDWARTPWPDAGVNAGAVARDAAASHEEKRPDEEGSGPARQIKTSAADRAAATERKARGK